MTTPSSLNYFHDSTLSFFSIALIKFLFTFQTSLCPILKWWCSLGIWSELSSHLSLCSFLQLLHLLSWLQLSSLCWWLPNRYLKARYFSWPMHSTGWQLYLSTPEAPKTSVVVFFLTTSRHPPPNLFVLLCKLLLWMTPVKAETWVIPWLFSLLHPHAITKSCHFYFPNISQIYLCSLSISADMTLV